MSFPPRPPMGMPTMMGQGYGFPPVGMMGPMGMMPTPMMRSGPSNNSAANAANAALKKRLIPQEIPKETKEDKPPVTTAFVGNISDRAPDAMVRQMLQRCGNVLSWKRVQGASGKLQAFGFCEYEDPEATLRCMRLLNSWKISDKTLVVKVDAKTKTLLDEYKKKKRVRENNSQEKRNGDKGDEEDEPNGDVKDNNDDLDEFTKREDRVAKAGLDAIMREYAIELEKEPSHGENRADAKKPSAEERKEKRKEQRKEKKDIETKDAGLDDMELEEGKKDLINREIQSFRDAHKGEEEKEAERNRERERRRREEERERERRERERDRERREKERDAMKRERATERGNMERERERERTRSRSRERTRSRSRDRERERHERERERELEDEEDAYERRKLEKKLREKEAGYQERLKAWEGRERKKTREYEKEREKEEERKAEEAREARRLKEFLEDYDDERDDPKYYKGSALQRRLKEREKEMEADARDRQREKEEIDEIRRRLLEEGHPNLEEQMARIERERDEHLMPRLHNMPPSPIQVPPSPPPPLPVPKPLPMSVVPPLPSPVQSPVAKAHQPQQQQVHLQQPQYLPPQPQQQPPPVIRMVDLPPEPHPLPPENSTPSQSSPESDGCEPLPMDGGYSEDSASQPFIGPATRADQQKAKIGFSSLKLGGGRLSESPNEIIKTKRKKLTVGDVFNQDDDDVGHGPKKRKLEPLDYSQAEKQVINPRGNHTPDIPSRPTTAEEKRKCIKMLIEKIPTAKEELFAYTLDWNMVDTTLMDRRIKPWVNKKIVEYIGEEEPTLTDFICQKVMAHSAPQIILNDVAMVLDEEAEVFVVKMWRLLIYETEAKKAGLVK